MQLPRLLPALFVLGAVSIVQAQGPPILAMTEVPNQPVNGLTVNGVTFAFTIAAVPSTAARINALNGGQLTYTQDPTLEGNSAGKLTMTFANPTTYLQFGVARSAITPMPAGAVVDLFSPGGALLGTIIVPVQSITSGADEGLVIANGLGLIGKAEITFPDVPTASQFAIDNVVTAPFESFLWFFY